MKPTRVKIIQVFIKTDNDASFPYEKIWGLGSDSKIYEWVQETGNWDKA